MYTSFGIMQTINMFPKVVVLISQVFLIKTVVGQCIGNIGDYYGIRNCDGVVGNSKGLLNPCGGAHAQLASPQLNILDSGIVSASYGGSFSVQALSPFAPGTISVHSENQIQGPLSVYGTLPFLSAVAFEGSLPTHGSGAVTYQCGDGRVTILEENTLKSDYQSFAPGKFGEGYNSIGAGWGLARSGINEINNCVQSVPNVYGQYGGYGLNANKGTKCGCGY